MRDLINNINPKRALSAVASAGDNTPLVSQIIDVQGYDSLSFIIDIGAVPDSDATFAVTMDEGDASNLSGSNAVASGDLIGTLALAGFQFDSDNTLRKIGYRGTKRYVRLTITPSANASATLVSVIAILGHPSIRPTSNPPS
jgi:hypothetical protein